MKGDQDAFQNPPTYPLNLLDMKICDQAKGRILLTCGREKWWKKIHFYSEVFLIGANICWEERRLWKVKREGKNALL